MPRLGERTGGSHDQAASNTPTRAASSTGRRSAEPAPSGGERVGAVHTRRQRWVTALPRLVPKRDRSAEAFLPAKSRPRTARRRTRCDAVLVAVTEWTENGESARAIGERLGVTSRSVVRYRNVCRDRALIA